jgi:hypothetical protein
MMLVPKALPVTNPLLSMVAMLVDADTHGFEDADVPDPDNCVVAFAHTVNVPVMLGKVFTVITAEPLFPLPTLLLASVTETMV